MLGFEKACLMSGMSKKEIADKLGTKPNTMDSWINRNRNIPKKWIVAISNSEEFGWLPEKYINLELDTLGEKEVELYFFNYMYSFQMDEMEGVGSSIARSIDMLEKEIDRLETLKELDELLDEHPTSANSFSEIKKMVEAKRFTFGAINSILIDLSRDKIPDDEEGALIQNLKNAYKELQTYRADKNDEDVKLVKDYIRQKK